MTRAGIFFGWVLALVACAGVTGCLPSSRSEADEVKEPHFVAGRAREAGLDYKGAMESFEKALEVNPGNASAHFELALLCEKNETDLAGAIYHYDRYLRLRPGAQNVEIVKGRLLQCKQLLAGAVSPVSPTPNMQRDLERLTAENRELKRQLEAWQAYFASHPQTGPNAPSVTGTQPATGSGTAATQASQPDPSIQRAQATAVSGSSVAGRQTASAATRTYRVQSGDTPIAIARKYGVKLEALLAANPDLDPKRMKVNQQINIPPP